MEKKGLAGLACGLLLIFGLAEMVLPTFFPSVAWAGINDGLVAYYCFDDANNLGNDCSGNANHGTVVEGNVTAATGLKGEAAVFGGYFNPAAIHVPNSNSLQFGQEFSVAFAVKMAGFNGMDGWGGYADSGAHAAVAKSHDRIGMAFNVFAGNAQGNVYSGTTSYEWGASASGIGKIAPASGVGKWVHFTYTFSNTQHTAKLYANGVLIATNNAFNQSFDSINGEDLYIGKFSDSWYPLNGMIDEVRFYNRALTATEVTELYRPSPSNYDLSVGGTVTVNPDLTRNEFWVHEYYQPPNKQGGYICDGTHGATHTGRDTHTEQYANRRLNKIRSYGFGRVDKIDFETSTTPLTYISITHLLNSGETVQANLLHGLYDNFIHEGDYIVKKQLLGNEDSKGAGGAVHLHTEIASRASLAWICTSNAVPSSDGTISPKPEYNIDDLGAHYDKNKETLRYYSPEDTFNNHLELLPWLSTDNPTPSYEGGYSVYGIANHPLYGQLNLNRTSAKFFKAIGILVKGGTDRTKPIDITPINGKWLARSWSGNVAYNDVSVSPISVISDFPIRGDHRYVLPGDYLAYPFVAKTEATNKVTSVSGYPVIFSILNNQESKIIDNDKKVNNGSTIYANTGVNKQKPGYYLSSDIALGKSGATSKWLPDVVGNYNLSVFIPEKTDSKVVYKVKTQGKSAQLACVIQDNTGGSWASLIESPAVDANGDGKIDISDLTCTKGGSIETPTEFNFSEDGYVVVSLLKEPTLGQPPLLVGDNPHLKNTNQVAFDAVKFDFVRE